MLPTLRRIGIGHLDHRVQARVNDIGPIGSICPLRHRDRHRARVADATFAIGVDHLRRSRRGRLAHVPCTIAKLGQRIVIQFNGHQHKGRPKPQRLACAGDRLLPDAGTRRGPCCGVKGRRVEVTVIAVEQHCRVIRQRWPGPTVGGKDGGNGRAACAHARLYHGPRDRLDALDVAAANGFEGDTDIMAALGKGQRLLAVAHGRLGIRAPFCHRGQVRQPIHHHELHIVGTAIVRRNINNALVPAIGRHVVIVHPHHFVEGIDHHARQRRGRGCR